MAAYYNEIEPFAAQWLRNLIAAGHIAPGDVDERSIVEVQPDDLRDYDQCHFFAGIAGWSLALRMAMWPDARPVWTGSCPCQPFSAAGKQRGEADERHLWPEFYRLIRACNPPVVFGEQVASAGVVGRTRSRVSNRVPAPPSRQGSDPSRQTEGGQEELALQSGRARGGDPSADRCWTVRGDGLAAELGQRQDVGQPFAGPGRLECGLYDREHAGRLPRCEQRHGGLGGTDPLDAGAWHHGEADGSVERLISALGRRASEEPGRPWLDLIRSDLERAGYAVGACVLPACGVGAPHIRQRLWWVADSISARLERRDARSMGQQCQAVERGGEAGELGKAASDREWQSRQPEEGVRRPGTPGRSGSWDDLAWLPCRDGKARPTRPGLLPLAHGVSGRVGRLRAYGNAIVPQVAAQFIGAVMECRP